MERMNVVIVGHVDHGKSTFTGRLLADTGSLPEGKLDQVKAWCAINSRPFEYAFLLDALKDEQAQGVTIDAARCFFKSDKRHYIIIDAPGHIEFLKNMITGAARAEAAILLIDAHEGVQENSRRHGYMLSMLGIKQVAVLINKMDLANFDEAVFNRIKDEYSRFLTSVGVKPSAWVPVCARDGDNLISPSERMPWYTGLDVLAVMDAFHKELPAENLPFRLPVQDVYKFTAQDDDRRIVAGTIVSGTINEGDEVIFLPSEKRSKIAKIEGFNVDPQSSIGTDMATGFTLTTQIFVKPGEMMCKTGAANSHIGTQFKANIFWLGKNPLVLGKKYKLKLGSARVPMVVKEIINVLNAAELSSEHKPEVGRHEVAEVVFQTQKPIAFDTADGHPLTSRFVIVDGYEIAGGGIVVENRSNRAGYTARLEFDSDWQMTSIDAVKRAQRAGHSAAIAIVFGAHANELSKAIETSLFEEKIREVRATVHTNM
jgi:bifunctional enzyme CysN/CysC